MTTPTSTNPWPTTSTTHRHRAAAGAPDAELAVKRSRGRRGGRRDGTVKGKPPRWRRLVVIVLALGLIGAGVAVAYGALRPVVEGFLESNDYAGPGDG